jgi:ABC-type glutathione transport system ATPase component
VGESGSGKTVTALACCAWWAMRISGQALLDGRDLLALPEREMQACAAAISP